jgi:hypothetical protein
MCEFGVTAAEQRAAADNERLGPASQQIRKGGVDLANAAGRVVREDEAEGRSWPEL